MLKLEFRVCVPEHMVSGAQRQLYIGLVLCLLRRDCGLQPRDLIVDCLLFQVEHL